MLSTTEKKALKAKQQKKGIPISAITQVEDKNKLYIISYNPKTFF